MELSKIVKLIPIYSEKGGCILKLCKKCNYQIEEDLNFCPGCGTDVTNGKQRMTDIPKINTEVTAPCKKCGYQVDDGLRFCPGCGSRVTEKKTAPPPTPLPEIQAVAPMYSEKKASISFCSNCGNQLPSEMALCAVCNANNDEQSTSTSEVTTGQQQAMPYTKQTTTIKKGFLPLVMLSLALMANILFVPMFSIWGGLFPSGSTHTFVDALDGLDRFFGGSYRLWPEIFIWSAFVPAVILLISALTKGKIMAMLSSAAGIGLLLYNLNRYIAQVGMDFALNADHGNISIGFWIALGLFASCFLSAISTKKIKSATPQSLQR